MRGRIHKFLSWCADSRHYALVAPWLLGAIIAATAGSAFLRRIEFEIADSRMRALANAAPDVHPDLIFVGIGDPSIERIGRWPWVRSEHAHFLNLLRQNPPRIISYDILFADKSVAAEDEALARAALELAAVGGQIAFAAHLDSHTGERLGDGSAEAINRDNFGFIEPLENVRGEPAPAFHDLYAADEAILPLNTLMDNAMAGFVDCLPDADGGHRRVPLLVKVGDEFFPTLVTQALMLFWNLRSADLEVEFGEHLIFHRPEGDEVVPITDRGELVLNWRRVRSAQWQGAGYDALEFAALSKQHRSAENEKTRQDRLASLAGKILVVGQNSTGLSAVGMSPLDPRTPLPTVHLNAINSILTKDFVWIAPFWPSLAVWLGVALSSCWWLKGRSIGWAVVVPIGLMAIYVGTAFLIYLSHRWMIPVVWPVLFFAVLHIGAGTIRWLKELQQRLEIRSVFASYVSGPLLDHLLEHPDAVALDGEVLPVTVFFSDIRSFTTITETMGAPELVEKLNQYFTEMVGCVHAHNGTMHKYIGDAIMAVWGDILDQSEEKSANEAVAAALEMRERLKTLNQRWREKGEVEFEVGIGINHGEVRVGHIGAPDRREFTVIGDAVNVASRIEGLTKMFNTDFLIGENVEKLLAQSIIRRPVGLITAKGKTKPVRVYEVIDRLTPETEALAAWADRFEQAFEHFLGREFSAARTLFEECFAERKDDPIAKNYIESCRDLAQNPPGDNWHGVMVMRSK